MLRARRLLHVLRRPSPRRRGTEPRRSRPGTTGGNTTTTGRSRTRALGGAAPLCVASIAHAAPVTLDFQGSVTGYEYLDLSAGLPVGADVSLSLTFNDTFSDGTYSFDDDLGPVSGSISVGGASFAFDGVTPFSYSHDSSTGEVIAVRPQFTGTGPALATGEFFGLFATFAPNLTLVGDLLPGYGFTTTSGDGSGGTGYGDAKLAPTRYSITPTSVPEPPTLALLVPGAMIAVAGARRRRTADGR